MLIFGGAGLAESFGGGAGGPGGLLVMFMGPGPGGMAAPFGGGGAVPFAAGGDGGIGLPDIGCGGGAVPFAAGPFAGGAGGVGFPDIFGGGGGAVPFIGGGGGGMPEGGAGGAPEGGAGFPSLTIGEGAAALRGEALESMPCKACSTSFVTLPYTSVEDEGNEERHSRVLHRVYWTSNSCS